MPNLATLAPLADTAADLIHAAITPATAKCYNTTLSQFQSFLSTLDNRYHGLPANPGQVLLFIAHLYRSGLSAQTIRSKMSAISYFHKLMSRPDPLDSFIVQKALAGLKNVASSHDNRLPITLTMLQQLLELAPKLISGDYYVRLVQAMMCLSFYALLRPGEVTASHNNLLFQNVQVQGQQLLVTFVTYKHHQGKPVSLLIPAQQSAPCPVQYLSAYLSVRGNKPGPLFCHLNCKPISYNQYRGWFHTLIQCLSGNNVYGLHSFRIGAATLAASRNISSVLIQQMGRWRSNAYTRYVRIPVIKF